MSQSIFKSTATYYARYRLPYPDEIVARVVGECRLDGRQRLLDLGCGTGQVCLSLAPHVASIVAIDPDSDMLECAAREAARNGHANVRFVQARAEEFGATHGAFDLITAGASFHWMDRGMVARSIARDLLVPRGRFAILGSNSLWNGDEPWQHAARSVIQRWLGERRRAGTSGIWSPGKPHQTVLVETGYSIEEAAFEVRHEWSLDTLLGYLYSTSFASRDLLGKNRLGFEEDLERTMLACEPSGQYVETLRYHLILAIPPPRRFDPKT